MATLITLSAYLFKGLFGGLSHCFPIAFHLFHIISYFQEQRNRLVQLDSWANLSTALYLRNIALIILKSNVLEGDGGHVTPVDYKRGEAPDIPEGAYEPERVQLCAQEMVLRENGFVCNEFMGVRPLEMESKAVVV